MGYEWFYCAECKNGKIKFFKSVSEGNQWAKKYVSRVKKKCKNSECSFYKEPHSAGFSRTGGRSVHKLADAGCKDELDRIRQTCKGTIHETNFDFY